MSSQPTTTHNFEIFSIFTGKHSPLAGRLQDLEVVNCNFTTDGFRGEIVDNHDGQHYEITITPKRINTIPQIPVMCADCWESHGQDEAPCNLGCGCHVSETTPLSPDLVPVASASNPGTIYEVNVVTGACTCKGYEYRGRCRHLEVARHESGYYNKPVKTEDAFSGF